MSRGSYRLQAQPGADGRPFAGRPVGLMSRGSYRLQAQPGAARQIPVCSAGLNGYLLTLNFTLAFFLPRVVVAVMVTMPFFLKVTSPF